MCLADSSQSDGIAMDDDARHRPQLGSIRFAEDVDRVGKAATAQLIDGVMNVNLRTVPGDNSNCQWRIMIQHRGSCLRRPVHERRSAVWRLCANMGSSRRASAARSRAPFEYFARVRNQFKVRMGPLLNLRPALIVNRSDIIAEQNALGC